MQIKLNEKGFITDFAIVGTIEGGIEVNEPKDIDHFMEHFTAYKVKNNAPDFDSEEDNKIETENTKQALRQRRQTECFSYVNRGQLWYATLSVKQLAELTLWYKAWLNVTETMSVPERPAWLEEL
jgi:hypothetical protein